MHIRKYRPGDEVELWQLFFHTIRRINIRDYSKEQVRAWAPEKIDAAGWRERIQRIDPFVCEQEGRIVGYADLQTSGLIDHFFVHHLWQGQGVGKRLFAKIESTAQEKGIAELTDEVSITARPFFESRGFRVVAAQEVALESVVLKNFKMAKSLAAGGKQHA